MPPKPGATPGGSNVGPDGKPISPALDANGNPIVGGVPGQGPGGVPGTPGQPGQPMPPKPGTPGMPGQPMPPQPGMPGGPPMRPGLPQDKFNAFAGSKTVDELLSLLAGENLEQIGANISEQQASEIFAKYGTDPKFLAFIGAGPPAGGPGQPMPPKPGATPGGSNVGPDGKPINPALDANGNPIVGGVPGQGPGGVPGTPGQPGQPMPPKPGTPGMPGQPMPPQPGMPGGPPMRPGLPQDKFNAFAGSKTVDELLSLLAGENLEQIGANISEQQASEIFAKYGTDPKFLAFIGAGPPAGGPGQPMPPKPGTPGMPGQPMPPQPGMPGGPPMRPGLPQQKFDDLRTFRTVDDLIAKLQNEDLGALGSTISDEQGSAILAALRPEELDRLVKFIEAKFASPSTPPPSPIPSAQAVPSEPVRIVGTLDDNAQ